MGSKPLNKYKVSSRKADALRLMLTFQSSLAENCSCIFCIQTIPGYYRVNHDLLMTHLSYKLKDKELLKLIAKYLRAGIMNKNHFEESREGVPQGGPLSPLLANIMLDPLDKELEKRGHKFARYADDFTILVKSKRAGERILNSISNYLERRLKLIVNSDKSRVVKTSESKFLGFTFRSGKIQIHPKTLYRFKEQVRRLTNRNWGPIYIKRICAINSLKPVSIYEAGLIIFCLYLNSVIAINFVCRF